MTGLCVTRRCRSSALSNLFAMGLAVARRQLIY